MPHELPYGMSAEGLGLRPARAMFSGGRGRVVAQSLMEDAEESYADEDDATVVARERSFEAPRLKSMPLAGPFTPPAGAPPPKAPAQPAPAKKVAQREPAPAFPRALRGRVALQKPDALILEVAIDGAPLDWAPDGAVELVLEDGSTVRASVVSSLSTRAGRLEPGQIARLGVAVRGMLAAGVRRVILRRGGDEIVIDLS
jgi:hypothetical protein